MTWRVKSRRVFSDLRARGIRVRSGPVRLSYLSVSSPQPQLAFAIGRRFGSAVERNRAQRRLRAAFETAWASSPAPLTGAYLMTAERAVLSVGFTRLVESVSNCLGQISVKASDRASEPVAERSSAALGSET